MTMNNINADILIKAENYMAGLFKEKLPDQIHFHNLEHAKYVVDGCEIIGRQSGLSEDDLSIVKCAAWFHDAGYVVTPENHEEESVKIALDFLQGHQIGEDMAELVKQCILATRIPQAPGNLMASVLCDADLRHLSDDNYLELTEKMRQEWTATLGEKYSKRKFHSSSVKFFQKHHYHTDYAIKNLGPKKEKNLENIHNEIYILEQKKENKIMEAAKKQDKKKTYSRGVESMFRLTARNQISLSSIADNKSNILITVNTLVLSIAMTVLISRFEEVPNIILPTLIFITFSLITIIFAILSTRPNISSGRFTKEDIKEKKVNLIFFGNFYNMKLDEYEWAIEEMIKDNEYLYSTMIKDQYSLGRVLAKKYKLLRIAYNFFMVGIVISVTAFILAFINI